MRHYWILKYTKSADDMSITIGNGRRWRVTGWHHQLDVPTGIRLAKKLEPLGVRGTLRIYKLLRNLLKAGALASLCSFGCSGLVLLRL